MSSTDPHRAVSLVDDEGGLHPAVFHGWSRDPSVTRPDLPCGWLVAEVETPDGQMHQVEPYRVRFPPMSPYQRPNC